MAGVTRSYKNWCETSNWYVLNWNHDIKKSTKKIPNNSGFSIFQILFQLLFDGNFMICLNDIALFDVVKVFDLYTTIISFGDLFDVVFETF